MVQTDYLLLIGTHFGVVGAWISLMVKQGSRFLVLTTTCSKDGNLLYYYAHDLCYYLYRFSDPSAIKTKPPPFQGHGAYNIPSSTISGVGCRANPYVSQYRISTLSNRPSGSAHIGLSDLRSNVKTHLGKTNG